MRKRVTQLEEDDDCEDENYDIGDFIDDEVISTSESESEKKSSGGMNDVLQADYATRPTRNILLHGFIIH